MTRHFLFAALGLALIAAASPDPVSEIRRLRSENNLAIAHRDGAAMKRAYLPSYKLIRGFGGELLQGPDNLLAELASTDWNDPQHITYRRTPDRIVIASDGRRASETGHWEGLWRSGAPVTRRTGEYLAVWVPTPQGWRLRSESYVALGCEGRGC